MRMARNCKFVFGYLVKGLKRLHRKRGPKAGLSFNGCEKTKKAVSGGEAKKGRFSLFFGGRVFGTEFCPECCWD